MVGYSISCHGHNFIPDGIGWRAFVWRGPATDAGQPHARLPPGHFSGLWKRSRLCYAESFANSDPLAGIAARPTWVGDGCRGVFCEASKIQNANLKKNKSRRFFERLRLFLKPPGG